MRIKQEITFAKNDGLNSDVSLEFMGAGDSRYRLNCRSFITAEGNALSVENIAGNTKVSARLWIGVNTVIGECADIENDAIVYFIHNNSGGHSIFRYLSRTNVIERILYNELILGFNLEYPVSHSNIVDGILFWTYGYKQPRQLHLQRALNYTSGAAVTPENTYLALTEQALLQIATPPIYSPSQVAFSVPQRPEYWTDDSYKQNHLRDSLYQFAFRHTYIDNRVSVKSETSKVPIPYGDENATGIPTYLYQNNVIRVPFDTGSSEIKRVDILARTGNIGDWRIIEQKEKFDSTGQYDGYLSLTTASMTIGDVNISLSVAELASVGDQLFIWGVGIPDDTTFIKKPTGLVMNKAATATLINAQIYVARMYDNCTYLYDWYNNKVTIALDQDDIDRPFDYVPQIAGTQDVLHTNEMVWGDITEGYDNVPVDVELEYLVETVDAMVGSNTNFTVTNIMSAYEFIDIAEFYPATRPFVVGDLVTITLQGLRVIPGVDFVVSYYTKTITQEDLTDVDIIAEYFRDQINDIDEIYSSTYDDVTKWLSVYRRDGNAFVGGMIATITGASSKFKEFKFGAWHEFGLIYKDAEGRAGAVNTSENCRIYMPFLTEIYNDLTNKSNYYINAIRWQINHAAPAWATSYSWVYAARSTVVDWFQSRAAFTPAANTIEVDVDVSLTEIRTARPNFIIPNYIWQKGDRMRFITEADGHTLLSQYVDVEILGPDNATDQPTIALFNYAAYNIGNGSIVEVYRPAKNTDNAFYFEVSESYPITAGVHSQTSGRFIINYPLTGVQVNTVNNAFKYQRYHPTASYIVESPHFSEYYSSEVYDIGTPHIVNKEAKQSRLKGMIRKGGKYLENTQTNQIAKAEANDYILLPEENGAVTILKEIGYTLKAVQEKKNNSIYISRTEYIDANGKESLVRSDDILGTLKPSQDDYGCQTRGAFVLNDRSLYFADVRNGAVVRDSANGMYDISKYRFKKEISDMFSSAIKGDDLTIRMGFNERFMEMNMTTRYIDKSGSIPKTIESTLIFNEADLRWKCYASYIADYYASIGNVFVSFKNGELWVHDSGLYNNFYGTQYEQQIDFAANMVFDKVKVFDFVGINTNNNKFVSASATKAWDVAFVIVEPSVQYPQGLYSYIPAGKLRHKEGILYGDILRDVYTPMTGTTLNKLINGRPMRGTAARIMLRNKSDQSVVLNGVIIGMTFSEKSK